MIGALSRRWSWPIFIVLAIVAGFLRFYRLSDVPHTLWVDDAWFSLKGAEVLAGSNYLPLSNPSLGVGNSPYQIYAAAAVQGLGLSTAYSSRIASAVSGWLTVLLLIPTLLALFDEFLPKLQRTLAAVFGVAVLATQFSSLVYSRIGMQAIASGLVAVLVVLGLYLTFQRNSWRWAILTGTSLSLALTTYEAAFGLPVLAFLYASLRLAQPQVCLRKRAFPLAVIILLAWLATFSPFIYFYARHPGILLTHLWETQSVLGEGGTLGAMQRGLVGFRNVWAGVFVRGDVMPGRNLVGRPLFDPFLSILIGVGGIWAGAQARRVQAAQLLLLWPLVMAVPSALSSGSPAFNRMIPMVPPLAGLAGLGAVALGSLAFSRGSRTGVITAGVLTSGLLLSGLSSVATYFTKWSHDPRLFDAHYAGARLTAENALSLASSDRVLLTTKSEDFVRFPFELLLSGTPVTTFDAAPSCLPFVDNSPSGTDYGVILVTDRTSLATLNSAYPNGKVILPVMHPAGYAYSLFFHVPAGTKAPDPTQDLEVVFENGLRLAGFDLLREGQPVRAVTLRLYWKGGLPQNEDLAGFVHIGKGRDSQPLIGQQDGPICPGFATARWLPSFVYIESRTLELTPVISEGVYDIRVGVYRPSADARLPVVSSDRPVEDNRVILTDLRLP